MFNYYIPKWAENYEDGKMHKYTATLKHDQGTVKITVMALSKLKARIMIMKAENCPDRAIIKLEGSN